MITVNINIEKVVNELQRLSENISRNTTHMMRTRCEIAMGQIELNATDCLYTDIEVLKSYQAYLDRIITDLKKAI